MEMRNNTLMMDVENSNLETSHYIDYDEQTFHYLHYIDYDEQIYKNTEKLFIDELKN